MAVVRAAFADRTVLVAACFPFIADLARDAVLFAVFVAAVARAGFERWTVFFGVAFPLTAARGAALFTVFFAAVARAGFARATVFLGIAFPLTACRVLEVPLLAVRVGDVVDFVSITTYQAWL